MKAVIVWESSAEEENQAVAQFLASLLEGYDVRIEQGLDGFLTLSEQDDLIVPVVSGATIIPQQLSAVLAAVSDHGTGLAGCHNLCAAFTSFPEWHLLTGGTRVAHPGDPGTAYPIHVLRHHEITQDIEDFEIGGDGLYLHTDPGNYVLAFARFPAASNPYTGNPCEMPQVWVKTYGQGKVFYAAFGRDVATLEQATPRELVRRGLLWATREPVAEG